MYDKRSLNLTVLGYEDDIISFLRLCSFINECVLSGHHGIVTLHVDGDGSASLSIREANTDKAVSLGSMERYDGNDLWIGE